MKEPTIEEQTRLDRVARSGCVVCRLSHGAYVDAEIQHLTSGGRRRGHRYTIPLCPWHHRGVRMGNFTTEEMNRLYGPSFANSRAAFEKAFGLEEYLLEETDRWLGLSTKKGSSSVTSLPPQPSMIAESARITPKSSPGSGSS